MCTGPLPGVPGRASSHLPNNTVTVRTATAGAAAKTGHGVRDQIAQSAAAVRSKATVTGGLATVVIASATKCSGAGPPPRLGSVSSTQRSRPALGPPVATSVVNTARPNASTAAPVDHAAPAPQGRRLKTGLKTLSTPNRLPGVWVSIRSPSV